MSTHEYAFSHTSVFNTAADITETDYKALSTRTDISRILHDLKNAPDQDDNHGITPLRVNMAISLAHKSLGVLVADRQKRRSRHDAAARQLEIRPPVSADGERNINSSSLNRMIGQFISGIAQRELPAEFGLEIGHREHIGVISEDDKKAVEQLGVIARETLESLQYIADVRDAAPLPTPRVTSLPLHNELLSIHRKTPLFDATPHTSKMPRIEQLDVFMRETFSGFSRPGRALSAIAIEQYVAQHTVDRVEQVDDESWVLPISTSLIIRAHPSNM